MSPIHGSDAKLGGPSSPKSKTGKSESDFLKKAGVLTETDELKAFKYKYCDQNCEEQTQPENCEDEMKFFFTRNPKDSSSNVRTAFFSQMSDFSQTNFSQTPWGCGEKSYTNTHYARFGKYVGR